MDKIGWIIVFFFIGVFVFLLENRRSHKCLSLNRYNIISDKIPKAFHDKKIAFLSDLHNNEIGKNNKKIMEMLEQEQPDYVLIGGDMLVSKVGNQYETAVSLLAQIAEKYPVYCGNGNHEARLIWNSEKTPETGVIYENYMEAIKQAGVKHLYNQTVRIVEGNDYIYLSELELGREFYKKLSSVDLPESYIERNLGHCADNSFHILLAHNPAYFETYSSWGADLTLSGHYHGGIMRLPFAGGVIDPAFHLFPKYDAGLFEKEGKKMVVSVGLGTHSIKIRLFNPPKIDFITLKCH